MYDLGMRALWLEDQTLQVRDDVPKPSLAPAEAIVRVSLAGVCNTDLELVRGYYPYTGVPGHEFVGTVEAAEGAREWRGRRVVAEINASCRRCETCRAGRPTHCEKRTVLGISAATAPSQRTFGARRQPAGGSRRPPDEARSSPSRSPRARDPGAGPDRERATAWS